MAATLVLAGVAGAALWLGIRPEPHPPTVAMERWQTPAFDIASHANRWVLDAARNGRENTLSGRWIGDNCYHTPDQPASAVFLFGRENRSLPGLDEPASRIHIQLWEGRGRVTVDRFHDYADIAGRRRTLELSGADAAALMALFQEGGYADMPPPESPDRSCDPGQSMVLQSCIDGRYYAVSRRCEGSDAAPNLRALGERLDAFLAGRNPPEP